MDKKALIKAILATIGVVAYTVIGAIAIETESPLFIGLMIGPIIGAVLPFDHADCGHYIKRSNMATRFDEDNCHSQCITCNRFRQGNVENFRRNLVKKIGEDKVEELERKGRGIAKFSSGDIEELIKVYKEKVKELKSL